MTSINSTSSSSSTKVAYSYLQYKNKIGGLVSGMDIDSIMEKLMKAESAQMEKLQQQKQKYEWTRDAYRDVNTTLSSFRDGLWDDFGTSDKWNTKTATSTSSAVSVTPTNSASGNLSINVTNVATAASVKTTMQSGITSSTTMDQLGFTNGGSFTMSALKSDGTLDNGVEITYTSSDTIESVLQKINQKTGVSAIVLGNQISFTNKNTGKADTSMDVIGDTNGLFTKLGMNVTDVTTGYYNFDSQANFVQGTNAIYNVNGIDQESASNKFTVAGYEIELKDKTSSAVSISSTTDTDTLVNKVKSFVDTYNGLIKDLNTRVSEKRNVDYPPLTDAQKAEMTEDQITKWEAKAKAGLLKNDDNINTTLYSMRSTLSQYGSTSGDTLYKIGITTTKEWSDNGKLVIDEQKLRKAIEEDPNVLTRIFNGNSATGEKGIIAELRSSAQTAISNIEQTAGKATSTSDSSYSLGRTISGLDTKISDWKDRLKDIENRYWNQFSAMEQAIQKANSQSSIFSSGS